MTNNTHAVKWLYVNLLAGEAPLAVNVQRRIHRYATSKKEVDLAAGLARRADTIDEIDHALAGWAVAKVQSAWFARPGRDREAVTRRLRAEKRVTVLEVAATIEGLADEVYEALAAKDSTRIALRILTNPSANTTARAMAATTAAHAYGNLSWGKRQDLQSSLRNGEADVVAAFVMGLDKLGDIVRFLQYGSDGVAMAMNADTADRIRTLVLQALAEVREVECDTRKDRLQQRHRWYRPAYQDHLDTISTAVQLTAGIDGDHSLVASALTEIASLRTVFADPSSHDHDAVSTLDAIAVSLGSSTANVSTRSLQAAAATSTRELQHLLQQWTVGDDHIDHFTAVALLANPHMDAAVAATVVDGLTWRHRDRSRLLTDATYRIDVLASVMCSLYCIDDESIEKYCGDHDPKALWEAIVLTSLASDQVHYGGLLGSKFAHAGIVPKLPLSVFTAGGLPDWLLGAFAAHLDANLADDVAWDGFEILAKTHLGTVEQLLRAAGTATRRTR